MNVKALKSTSEVIADIFPICFPKSSWIGWNAVTEDGVKAGLIGGLGRT